MGIHDSRILSYTVNFNKKTLLLRLLDNQEHCHEVNFFGVLTHSFENILLSNIVFDIEESSVENFFEENEQLILKGQQYCWPVEFNDGTDLICILSKKKLRYYKIYSSFGLDGWILCEGYSEIYSINHTNDCLGN